MAPAVLAAPPRLRRHLSDSKELHLDHVTVLQAQLGDAVRLAELGVHPRELGVPLAPEPADARPVAGHLHQGPQGRAAEHLELHDIALAVPHLEVDARILVVLLGLGRNGTPRFHGNEPPDELHLLQHVGGDVRHVVGREAAGPHLHIVGVPVGALAANVALDPHAVVHLYLRGCVVRVELLALVAALEGPGGSSMDLMGALHERDEAAVAACNRLAAGEREEDLRERAGGHGSEELGKVHGSA
mmetsp:Transcript_51708/g.160427  ORF Transcript_51708/g.160427 Transcript_51708/m.160427 type:complete len:244 (-) Transcript_51708:22-753(-)